MSFRDASGELELSFSESRRSSPHRFWSTWTIVSAVLLDKPHPYDSLPSNGGHDGGSDGDLRSVALNGDAQEETFGPVIGIQKVGEPTAKVIVRVTELWQVSSDEEAIKLMNDSPYGLTASVWTKADSNHESERAFLRIVDELETGTVFLNRFVTPIG